MSLDIFRSDSERVDSGHVGVFHSMICFIAMVLIYWERSVFYNTVTLLKRTNLPTKDNPLKELQRTQ